ncbi:uncharacterized protein LOC118736384 [Rhagoletis pomonella]|uniref:uncharacterized protein LOC118736384 n=1 Tax=Rhagoletis pomonella TaxID=28610 RepID=UPI0017844A96|nr:uncharacterized protein LOC118736384 [Rhagoletis pomonella]
MDKYNKINYAHMNKDAKRSSRMPSRPGAETAALPNAGNSTQILYVEPNFTETPSEYDVFYDCFSDVEINQPSVVVYSKSGPTAPPPVKDSRMFRDALKQVINTAQMLLVEFEGSGRRERRGCGSRCKCDVRNMKPQSRTVQLEVTAKVAEGKSNVSPNIRIDPILFTIPLKLHLQGHGQGQRKGQGQRQHNFPYSESQQSYEIRKHIAVQDNDQMAKMFASMEPIRTDTIVAPRPEVSSIPMEGPAPAFNFHADLLQQMAAMQPGFLPLPLQVPHDSVMQVPAAHVVASKVQIEVPASAPLTTEGTPEVPTASTASKRTIEIQQTPVTQGPFVATIAASSVPSVGASLSETASQGVCVLCGRRGEHSHMQPESTKKPPCGICSPQPTQPPQTSELPAVPPLKGPSGKSTKTENSLVVLVPPVHQSVELDVPKDGTPVESPGDKGPGAVCSRGMAKAGKSPHGVCSRGAAPPIETEVGPCGICTRGKTPAVSSRGEATADLCKICNKYRAPKEPPKLGACGICSKPTSSMPMHPEVPIEPVKPKYFKALPQHKDIHICSPCRYDPSPLIDAEGNVFCPHNCGCCLCPWRKRATDSQIDQIKHEKIKVCKCRLKGSIFVDYHSRAKCTNTSNFDFCPCRERAEAKYLEMTGEEMWSTDNKLTERIRGEPVNLEDVVEHDRGGTT